MNLLTSYKRWFQIGAVIALIITLVISVAVGCAAVVKLKSTSRHKAMNSDPHYNGTLFFYVVVTIAEAGMAISSAFGLIIAYWIWRNDHQMNNRLKHLLAMWKVAMGLVVIFTFGLGMIGLVRYQYPQKKLQSLYEILAKNDKDKEFVAIFERYQRENNCCGIMGPDDWMMKQQTMGGVKILSLTDDSYLGRPPTGKCHLTSSIKPNGCGKKILEEIRSTRTLYGGVLLLETIVALVSVTLGWYCGSTDEGMVV